MNKLTAKNIALAIFPALIIGFLGCKGDTPTPTKTTPPPAPTEQYILMNGLKVNIKNPANGYIILQQGDTTLNWAGNKPSGVFGDSLVYIWHTVGVNRGASTISDFPTELGEVNLAIRYGGTDSKTEVEITEGEYKLEKVNDIWYSVLKNGKAEGTKGSTAISYTGVEFRVAWPSTFK